MNAPRLHICMAVTRPQNIPIIARNLIEAQYSHPFELRWHLAVQGPEPDPKGSRKFNEMVDAVPDGWLHLMADDTIHMPSLFARLGDTIAANPNAGVVMFNQERPEAYPGINSISLGNGKVMLRAQKEHMSPGYCCGGQAFYERGFLGNRRYNHQEHLHASDGYLLAELYHEAPERFVFVNEILVRFNSLEE